MTAALAMMLGPWMVRRPPSIRTPKTGVIMCAHIDKVSCREIFGEAGEVEEVGKRGDCPSAY